MSSVLERRGVTLFELLVVLTLLAVVASLSTLPGRRHLTPQQPFEQSLARLRREAVSRGVARTERLLGDSKAALVTALPDGRLIVADLAPDVQR